MDTTTNDNEMHNGLDLASLIIDPTVMDLPRFIHPSVEIKFSRFPKAGLGAFAKEPIKKGTFLGNYVGSICYLENGLSYKDDDHYGFYTIIRGKPAIINGVGLLDSNWTRYMNCALERSDENIFVMKNTDKTSNIYINQDNKPVDLDGAIVFFACKDIDVGEELLFDYGDSYKTYLLHHFY